MPDMDNLILWLGAILLLGGAVVCMAGLLLYRFARFLRHQNPKIRPEKWFWLAMLGLVMMLSGWGLWQLNRSPAAPPSDDPPSPVSDSARN